MYPCESHNHGQVEHRSRHGGEDLSVFLEEEAGAAVNDRHHGYPVDDSTEDCAHHYCYLLGQITRTNLRINKTI